MAKATIHRAKVPVHLVTGFLGVGKTTAINHLLATKPEQERWAVVVNEFGQIGVDGSFLDEQEGVRVKEIPGGCICCALGLTLSVTLVNLLQKYQPDRLLIEPTGLGHPAGIIDVLTGAQFADYVQLYPLINLVDPRQLEDPRVLANDTFQDQISLADVLVLNKSDLATEAQVQAALEQAQGFFPPKLALLTCEQGRLPQSVLESAEQLIYQQGRLPVAAEHSVSESSLLKPSQGLEFLAWPQPGQPVCQTGQGQGAFSVGWIFHRDEAFDEDQLYQWIHEQQGLLRLKGVFRVGSRDWRSFNKVAGELVVQPLAYRRDSRLELISDKPLNQQQIEQALLAMTYQPKPATLFD